MIPFVTFHCLLKYVYTLLIIAQFHSAVIGRKKKSHFVQCYRCHDILISITAAIQQRGDGVREITAGIRQMEDETQSLLNLSQKLADETKKFKL